MKIKTTILALLFAPLFAFSQGITPTLVDSVPMRDGKKLAADIYVPDTSQQWSTILVQTPYNRLAYRIIGIPLIGNALASSHFAVVIADWRCFYGSAAACTTNVNRGKDGYDLVEWIATQPWSNGKIGTWGPSALGKIQFETARQNPPHLICGVPLVGSPQFDYQEYYPGGVYRTEYVEQLDALGFGISTMVSAHPVHDILWTYSEFYNNKPDSVFVPMLMIGGWYDHETLPLIQFYNGIHSSSPLAVRNKHRLLMGPWAHGGFGPAQVGSAQQGELYYYDAVGWSDSLALMHLEYYLNNEANGWNTSPYIQYFQMGENTWQNTAVWPPTGLTTYNLYFHDDGSVNTTMPTAAVDYDSVIYDPRNPSPTIGGATLRQDLLQGPYDQAPAVENRNDILLYRSVVLGADVVMKGKATVHLFISSDRKDTDFDIRLTDIYPDGKSMLLADGTRRARFRNGYNASDTASLIPGTVYEIIIDLPDIANTFLAGHRIGIDVSSSNYPRYDCNLNNGKAMYAAGDTLIATNRIYTNSVHASYIEMPLIDFTGSVINNASEQTGFTIFPNPATASVSISLLPPNGRITNVQVLNSSGITVMSIDFRHQHSGTKTTDINTSALQQGIYFVKLTTENDNFISKLIIIR
ncbi:MAG: CocE/NonD family hydrolase [Bacteroidota bacterium]